MIRFVHSLADRLARFALAPLAIAALASCSGAVGPSTQVKDPTKITILPATVTAFSSLPVTFTITGGTGVYIVASSNQSIVPNPGTITGGSFTVIPNQVLVETAVTLTVRDTGTAPTQSANLTIEPGTVSNNITITPTPGQGCAPALCSGGDAEVSAVVAQGGIPLPARGVRFEVVSGDFLFISTDPNTGVTTLTTSVIVITDQTGKARARIRATPDAPNQTAFLQVTDLGTGAFQRTSFVIAQATGTSPGFFVTPTSVTFQGRRTDECAGSSISATFFVFGGVAPYTVSNTSSAFVVSPNFVSSSGGSFTVTPNGTCVAEPGAPIVIRDSSGRTVTVTAANIRGVDAVPALVVSPNTVSLTDCSSTAQVNVAGGSGRYVQNSGSGSIQATPVTFTGSTVRIQRLIPSPATPSPVNVGISDGNSTVTVTVNLSGAALGACDSSTFAVTPSTVTLGTCGPVNVTLSGGSGTYSSPTSDNSSVTATLTNPTTLRIQRASPSASFTPPATVTISDGSVTRSVTVNASGTGLGSGIGNCP